MEWEQAGLFFLICVILALTPGPDILFVLAQGLTRGASAALVTVAGFNSGVIFHTLAAVLGVSVLVRDSPTAFQALQYAGALYLFYLAFRALQESGSRLAGAQPGANWSLPKLYRRALLMNLLNPKVMLFFLAFLPQFVDPARASVAWQMFALGLLFMLAGILVFSLVGLFAAKVGRSLRAHPGVHGWLGRINALIFLLLGAHLLFF